MIASSFSANITLSFYLSYLSEFWGAAQFAIENVVCTTVGTFTITTANIPVTGNNLTITSTFPRPIINSIYPSELFVGSSADIIIEGTNFADDAVVIFKDTTLSVTRISNSKVMLTIPGSFLSKVGTDYLIIRNPSHGINSPPKGTATLQANCNAAAGALLYVTIDGSSDETYNICNQDLRLGCTDNKDWAQELRLKTTVNLTSITETFTVNRDSTVKFTVFDLSTKFRRLRSGQAQVYLYKSACDSTFSPPDNAGVRTFLGMSTKEQIVGNLSILNPAPVLTSILGSDDREIKAPIIVTLSKDINTVSQNITLVGSGFVENSRLVINGFLGSELCPTQICSVSKSRIPYNLDVRFPPGVVSQSYSFRVDNPSTSGFPNSGGRSVVEKTIIYQFTTPRINDVVVRTAEPFTPWRQVRNIPAERDTTIWIWGDNFIEGSQVILRNPNAAAGSPGITIEPNDVIFGNSGDPLFPNQQFLRVTLKYSKILELKGNNLRNIVDKPINIFVRNTKGTSDFFQIIIGKPLVKIERTEGMITAGRTSEFKIVGKKFVNYIALNDTSTTRVTLNNREIPINRLEDSTANPDNFQRIVVTVPGDSLYAARAGQQKDRNRLVVFHRQESPNPITYRWADTTYIYPVALKPNLIAILRDAQSNKPLKGIVKGEATTFTLVGDNLTHETALNIQGRLYPSRNNSSGLFGFSIQQPTRVNARLAGGDTTIPLGRVAIGVQNPIDAEDTPNRAWHNSNTLNINVYEVLPILRTAKE